MRVSGGFQEAHRQGGGHGEREDERCEQSGHHGERERAEEHTRHPVEECEWDEDHHGRERRAEEREADLANRLPNCVNGARAAHTLRMDVLDHHDRIIDDEADGRRDPPERHQVEAQVKWLHRGDGDQHGQRDHQDGHRRQPDVLQERDHDADREHEPEHDAFPDRTSRLAHQDRLVVEGRELHVARQDRAERVELLVHAGRHLDRARVRLAPNVEEHGVDALRGHDVETRGAPALDPGDVAEEDRGARRPEPHDGRGNVVGRGESPADERQVQLVILLQHARASARHSSDHTYSRSGLFDDHGDVSRYDRWRDQHPDFGLNYCLNLRRWRNILDRGRRWSGRRRRRQRRDKQRHQLPLLDGLRKHQRNQYQQNVRGQVREHHRVEQSEASGEPCGEQC